MCKIPKKKKMDLLLIAIIISGVHFLLLILSIILLYRRSRTICKERKENVTLLAKARRKEQRYNQAVADFRARNGDEQADQLILLATSPTSQKANDDLNNNNNNENENQDDDDQNENNGQPPAMLKPGALSRRRRRGSGTYHPSPVLRRRMLENQLYEAGYPEPLSPTTQRVLDEANHVVKPPTSDRFAFALISLLPVDVFFCCLGMWIAFVLRNNIVFWVGCIPLLHFLLIVIASSSIVISCASRM